MIKVTQRAQEVIHDVGEHGYTRVILLGTAEQMTSDEIRKPLAASGVLVLVPGETDRAQMDAIGEAPTSKQLEWLHSLLAHGIEHGAQAVLVMHPPLARFVSGLDLPVPVLDA